jgi:hypothetical protein
MTTEKPTPEEFRRWMLEASQGEMDRVLRESLGKDCPDPWVVVADLRDAGGRRVAVWLEAFSHGTQGAEGRVQSHLEYVQGMVSAGLVRGGGQHAHRRRPQARPAARGRGRDVGHLREEAEKEAEGGDE